METMEPSYGATRPHDSCVDLGVSNAVKTLRAAGVETYESCQGGEGHSYGRPTIRFSGTKFCGHLALGIAIKECWPVRSLARIWTFEDEEVAGPVWELSFREPPG